MEPLIDVDVVHTYRFTDHTIKTIAMGLLTLAEMDLDDDAPAVLEIVREAAASFEVDTV